MVKLNKKYIASVLSAAMAMGMCVMPAFGAIENANDGDNYKIEVADIIGNADANDVYGVKVTFPQESVDIMMANGCGGGIIFNNQTNGWDQKMWCNGCGADEEHDCQLDLETNSITRLEETPCFSAEDISGTTGGWCQIVLCQWWGGDITIESIELLDIDGNVIDTEANNPGENPSDNDPQDTSNNDPENPSDNDPEIPGESDPQNPSDNDPENPSDNDPENPSDNDPQNPSDNDPQNPSDNDPENPSDNDPQDTSSNNPGDVNGDGEVDTKDVVYIKRANAGWEDYVL